MFVRLVDFALHFFSFVAFEKGFHWSVVVAVPATTHALDDRVIDMAEGYRINTGLVEHQLMQLAENESRQSIRSFREFQEYVKDAKLPKDL